MNKVYTEDERIQFLKEAETGCITDSVKLAGAKMMAINGVLPLKPGMKLAGRVFTMVRKKLTEPGQKALTNFEMCDLIPDEPNLVGFMCLQGDEDFMAESPYCLIGENMVHAMKNKGLAGLAFLCGGRDYEVMAEQGIPVFGLNPAVGFSSTPSGWMDTNTPVVYEGLEISPGDYIIGDCDGILVIAQDEIDKVIYEAERVAIIEKIMEYALDLKADLNDLVKISALKRTPRD